MAKQGPLIGFGLFLKASRIGFHAVENYDGYRDNKPAYARAYEVSATEAILEVYTFEQFAKLKRPKRPEYIFAWWKSREAAEMLPTIIRDNEEEFKKTGRLILNVSIPPAPETS